MKWLNRIIPDNGSNSDYDTGFSSAAKLNSNCDLIEARIALIESKITGGSKIIDPAYDFLVKQLIIRESDGTLFINIPNGTKINSFEITTSGMATVSILNNANESIFGDNIPVDSNGVTLTKYQEYPNGETIKISSYGNDIVLSIIKLNKQ